jgi:DNA-binding SARP family transcriptional activator
MRALALRGERAQALHQYEVFRDLAQLMGVEPSSATTQLCEQIREGALDIHVNEKIAMESALGSPGH